MRSTDCITVPLAERAAPTRKAISTRGIRMDSRMEAFTPSSRPVRI